MFRSREGCPAGSPLYFKAPIAEFAASLLAGFLFIYLSAPYIKKLRGNKKLTAALLGVTAAVCGMILNLAVVFGVTVIWNTGRFTQVNGFAAAMSVAAFVALYRFKIDVLWVILAGGAIGFVYPAL